MDAEQERGYRPDIDGLRAIAVLSVIVFHVRHGLLSGGFVGVDVFFVISGYLISRHIAATGRVGRFSLAEFYRRRIRRIVPMAMTVIAATLFASVLLMTPRDAQAVAKSAVWAIASMANVHFWRELDTGYFAASSTEVPLLHLWSLGVEEQFYLLWPLLLAFAAKRLRSAWVVSGTLVLAVASFAAAAAVFPRDPSFAYYMLPTRMGELLLGAALGVASAGGRLAPLATVARASALGGLALLLGSLWFINSSLPFPGWFAVPPTLAAALLIFAGEGPRPSPMPGLSSPPMVMVGRLSYSAYLWHWPLIALWRYGYGEPGVVAGAGLVGATLFLAAVSYRYIEIPTRASRAPLRWLALRQLALPAIALALPALAIIYAPRLNLPLGSAEYLVRLRGLEDLTRAPYTFDFICQHPRLSRAHLSEGRCVVGVAGDAAPRTLIWGDSNAAHYVPMLQAFAQEARVSMRNIAVGACPPLLSDPERYVDAKRRDDCRHSANLVAAELPNYKVVIISAAWTSYLERSPRFIDDVAATLGTLVSRGQHVVLIGRAPLMPGFDRRCEEKALRVPFKTCPDLAQPLGVAEIEVNRRLRELAGSLPGVSYYDANNLLCPGGVCHAKGETGMPLYYDPTHLTVPASTALGRRALALGGLPDAFAVLRP